MKSCPNEREHVGRAVLDEPQFSGAGARARLAGEIRKAVRLAQIAAATDPVTSTARRARLRGLPRHWSVRVLALVDARSEGRDDLFRTGAVNDADALVT